MILMGFTVSSINYMMGGPSGGGRTGMKKTGLLKKSRCSCDDSGTDGDSCGL